MSLHISSCTSFENVVFSNFMPWFVIQVVLFEGWMLGFKPLPLEVVKAVDPQLETVNKNLEAYYDAWYKFINAWIVIKIKDPNYVYQWRLQVGLHNNFLSINQFFMLSFQNLV